VRGKTSVEERRDLDVLVCTLEGSPYNRWTSLATELFPIPCEASLMGDPIRVMMELGRKKPVAVAVAFDWPGWERSGTSEEDALRVLDTYRGRYATVAELAGIADEFRGIGNPVIIERLEGIGMTDFYGLSMRAAGPEEEQMSDAACERKIALLRACWTYFDDVASRVSAELRKGPRGGGRDRDRIVQHVNNVEIGDFARKVGVITPPEAVPDPDALSAHREAFCAAIREYNARGASARNWPVQFVIRHSAYHVLDHAWEMQDRDLSGDS
jgi:hypothetical protein